MTDGMPLVEGVQHRFVDAGGVTLHYAEAGSGEPLLLLHGWPQHWYMWRRQIPALAERYRVICPDLRGFGWSDAPRDGYDKEQLASDVISLCDALGIQRFRMMGHDWGGWVGFLIALFHPQRVERYLALNIPHPFGSPHAASPRVLWRFWYQALIATPGVGYAIVRYTAFVRRLLKAAAVHGTWSPTELEQFAGRFTAHGRARATVRLYRTFLIQELPKLLRGRYKAYRLLPETLLLFGTDDLAIHPALLAGYEPYAERMSVERVADAGHFIAEERSALVTQRALRFFGDEPASAGELDLQASGTSRGGGLAKSGPDAVRSGRAKPGSQTLEPAHVGRKSEAHSAEWHAINWHCNLICIETVSRSCACLKLVLDLLNTGRVVGEIHTLRVAV